MPLNAAELGADLNNAANNYNDKDIEDLAAARAAYWKDIATAIINHFTSNGVINVNVTTTGTATAQTGTGTGTIK